MTLIVFYRFLSFLRKRLSLLGRFSNIKLNRSLCAFRRSISNNNMFPDIFFMINVGKIGLYKLFQKQNKFLGYILLSSEMQPFFIGDKDKASIINTKVSEKNKLLKMQEVLII